MCAGPPQYKQNWFAHRRCFSASDKGPRRRAVSISIGVDPSHEMEFEDHIGVDCGDVTTVAYV